MMQITITTDHAASSYGIPVCLVDGQLTDDGPAIEACMTALGWDRNVMAAKTGKGVRTIDTYRKGLLPVPAEVYNVLRDALEARQ